MPTENGSVYVRMGLFQWITGTLGAAILVIFYIIYAQGQLTELREHERLSFHDGVKAEIERRIDDKMSPITLQLSTSLQTQATILANQKNLQADISSISIKMDVQQENIQNFYREYGAALRAIKP